MQFQPHFGVPSIVYGCKSYKSTGGRDRNNAYIVGIVPRYCANLRVFGPKTHLSGSNQDTIYSNYMSLYINLRQGCFENISLFCV